MRGWSSSLIALCIVAVACSDERAAVTSPTPVVSARVNSYDVLTDLIPSAASKRERIAMRRLYGSVSEPVQRFLADVFNRGPNEEIEVHTDDPKLQALIDSVLVAQRQTMDDRWRPLGDRQTPQPSAAR